MKAKLIPILIISIALTACASGLTPAPTAYPAPSTQTNLPPTQTSVPAITLTSPVKSTITAYPTRWRDFTPTPNSTPGVWPEFSSEFTYNEKYGLPFVGTVRYAIRYPPDWYLYPGRVDVAPGREGQTYLQNYERLGDDPYYTPLQMEGTVRVSLYALPCISSLGKDCPTDLPLLSSGLPGTKDISYQSSTNYTYWDAYLYVKGMQFDLHGYMPGTPEENAELIQILEEILASVRLS